MKIGFTTIMRINFLGKLFKREIVQEQLISQNNCPVLMKNSINMSISKDLERLS